MPDRRTFLMTCGGVVAATPLALASAASVHAPPLAATCVAEPAKTVALSVAGWDAINGDADAFVQINASWRANWR